MLIYKSDWEETKERYKAWWNHEDFGRCAIAVTAPRHGSESLKPPALPEKVEDRWLDFEYLRDINEYRLKSTFFGGEAVPRWHPGYPGWENVSAYLGCEVTLAEETGWLQPFMDQGELTDYDYNQCSIQPDNKWWLFSEKIHRFAVEQARGKSIPGIQPIGGCGDMLADMRGTEKLLYDVVDCPEQVKSFEIKLMKVWIEAFEHFYDIVKDSAEGSSDFMHLWAPGKCFTASNDFSYMISPAMYRQIYLPALEMQLAYLDYSIYHVDGPGAFIHVDLLCGLPGLTCLQILPGAGNPSPLHYMSVLKKVQASGKNLHISICPEEVEPALEQLSSRGLFISTQCDNEEDAKQLLKKAEQWSK